MGCVGKVFFRTVQMGSGRMHQGTGGDYPLSHQSDSLILNILKNGEIEVPYMS